MNTKSLDPSLFSSSAAAVVHPSHGVLLRRFIENPQHLEKFNREDVECFYQNARQFLNKHIENFNAFDKYAPFFSDGTTGFFHQIYLYLKKRNLAVFNGEYPYHKNICDRMGIPFDVLHLVDDIKEHHVLLLSLPFSGDGNSINNIDHIIAVCEQRNVPMFIDLALQGLSSRKTYIPYSHCIKAMTFSLTKSFNLTRYRVGCTFIKDTIWPGNELDHWNYVNLFSIRLANFFFNHFDSDKLIEIAKIHQKNICDVLVIEPSDSYIFGLSKDSYNEFSRDKYTNRICLSGAITQLLKNHSENELIK